MTQNREDYFGSAWLGVIAILFALLFIASHSNEILKQIVVAPVSAVEAGLHADCRADELEEEDLSLQECQLMLANVQIILASSPSWFRPFQIVLSSLGCLLAIASMNAGMSLVQKNKSSQFALVSFVALLLIDIVGFIAAINLGPLLRAQYLWPQIIWIAIHLSLLIPVFALTTKIGTDGVVK